MPIAQRLKQNLNVYWPFVLLLGLILFNMIFTRNFASIDTVWNILLQSFPVIIIAMGMTFVIATGGIDISVGATMAFSSIVFAILLIHVQTGFWTAFSIAMLAALLYGVFNGVMVSIFNIQPIIVTLILAISGRGIAQQVNNGSVLSFYGNIYSDVGCYRLFEVIPVQVVMIIFVVMIMYFITKKTVFGAQVQSLGENSNAAELVGINTRLILIAVYSLCALLAGAAAVVETLRMCSADPNNIGSLIELDCIAAVAVGGTAMSGGKAKIIGTLVGALIMQLITTMVNMNNIQYEYSLVIKSIIIVLALYFQTGRKK